MPSLRDFIYLDWERIRSFVAQVDRGVPETRTGSISDEEGTASEGEAGFKGFFSVGHSNDVRYTRSATETRSLHHAVFADFEKYLETSNLLRDTSPWDRDRLSKGGFFRVRGLIRLVDYAAVVSLTRGLKGLINVGYTLQKSQVRSDASLDQQEIQHKMREIDKDLKENNKSLNESGIDSMASTIETLYGDVVRVKIVPDTQFPDQVFVGTCDPEALDPSFHRAIGSRGYSTLWPVESLVFAETMTPNSAPTIVPTGNELEDSIDLLVGEMDALARIASGYEFPAVSCTPLAIYRVLDSDSTLT